MKPFNLEEAKAGKPLVTRDGIDAKFIAHVPEAKESSRVLFLVGSDVHAVYESGNDSWSGVTCDIDLFMKKVKKTVYVNIYSDNGRWVLTPGTFYTCEQACLSAQADSNKKFIAIAAPIEIEE